ncbi:MAG: hypothetical protein NTX81_01380 [Candidatus Bathyarchaeota archaeon]|nr:hypothetical protein [Candidatus Bathyarchaeota archaeon]
MSELEVKDGGENQEVINDDQFDVVEATDPIVYDEDVAEPVKETEEVVTETIVEPTVSNDEPDDPRFKGKSKREIERAYKEAERKMSEHANEVGLYRKLFDASVQQHQVKQVPQETVDDFNARFFENPKEVMNEMYSRAKQEVLQESIGLMNQNQNVQKAMETLHNEHPDRADIVNKPEFRAWLQTNMPPGVAAQGESDPITAAYVLRNYKNSISQLARREFKAQDSITRTRTAPTVSVPSSSAKSGGGEKVFRRTELAQMMLNNPQEYQQRQGEIMRAYAEGRVK